jgi:hypothetical protein
MALARMIERGVDVPGVGSDVLRRTGVSYYGISFGGIYGTMLMATDTHLQVGVLNVPGGPIPEIARLSGFRGDLADKLRVAKVGRPNGLLNGGPGLNGFTESLPLRGDLPVTKPLPGAIDIQNTLFVTDWYDRSGSPETFTPLVRRRPLQGAPPKYLLFQSAYGDQTVPNPTAGNIYRAGGIYDLVTYYRNDKTPTYASDPHGWLADPRLSGRDFGQTQMITFIASGGQSLINPNPAWFEVPVANAANFDCLHYPDPQTGQQPNPQPYPLSGDCVAAASTASPGPGSGASNPTGTSGGLPNTGTGQSFALTAVLAAGIAAAFAITFVRAGRAGRRRPLHGVSRRG